MKKFLKWSGVVLGCLGLFLFVGCSRVSQKYADKINNEAKDGDDVYITLEQVLKDLGDEAINLTIGSQIGTKSSGVVIAVKGCKSKEDIQKKLDNNEDVEGLIITILLNNATSASYRKITASDLK